MLLLQSPYKSHDVLVCGDSKLHRNPDGDCCITTVVDGEEFVSQDFRLDGGREELAELIQREKLEFYPLKGEDLSVTEFTLDREERVLLVKGAQQDGRRRAYRCFVEAAGGSALWLTSAGVSGTASTVSFLAHTAYCASVPLVSLACFVYLILRNRFERSFMQEHFERRQ